MIEVSEEDPDRTYTPEEEYQLTMQLVQITAEIHRGACRHRMLERAFLCDLHRALFANVRGHAGRPRGRGFGSEWLTFGPNRSEHRDNVDAQLANVFARVARELPVLLAFKDAEHPDYERTAIRLAVWAHADIIRIHPFEDGNGRTARLCAGHLLVQCDLLPVPIEAVKQEYTEALNHYHSTRDVDPLVGLFIELYPV